jgi:hypothetical protein
MRIRDDKQPEDASGPDLIVQLYERQNRKVPVGAALRPGGGRPGGSGACGGGSSGGGRAGAEQARQAAAQASDEDGEGGSGWEEEEEAAEKQLEAGKGSEGQE